MKIKALSFQNRSIGMCSSHRCILPLIITVLLMIPVDSQFWAMNTLVDYSVTNLQSDYYMRQARSYQREAEYYTRNKQDDRARSYRRKAEDETDKAQYQKKLANDAKETARQRLRSASDAMDRAKQR